MSHIKYVRQKLFVENSLVQNVIKKKQNSFLSLLRKTVERKLFKFY